LISQKKYFNVQLHHAIHISIQMENPRKRGGGDGSAAAGTTPRSKPATTATAREVESEWAGLTLEQFRAEVPRDPDDARFIFSFPAPASPSSALHTPQVRPPFFPLLFQLFIYCVLLFL
jgi:hypothetical protein